MQFIISAATWDTALQGDMRQDELPALAVNLGCKGVEFRPYWHDIGLELPESKRLLARYGLTATYACSEALLGQTMEEVQMSLAAMVDSINIAYLLDAPVLRIYVANGPFRSEFLRHEWWKKAVESLIGLAAEKNIVLAVENQPDPEAGNPALIKSILDIFASTHFRLAFDTGNWLMAKQKPSAAFAQLEEYIGYVHLKDMIPVEGTYEPSYLGVGAVEVMDLMSRILKSGYRGPLVLEFPGGEDPEEKVRASLDYLYGK